MNLTQEQVAILSNYFNGQADLPVVVAEIAAVLREVVTPSTPEVAAPLADPVAPPAVEVVAGAVTPAADPAPLAQDGSVVEESVSAA